jgi:TolA-binding protein
VNTAEQNFERIERYLQGKLPEAEARALEAQMAADPDFAALVQQHRLERQGLELLVERELLGKMQQWDRETEIFQQTTQPRRGVVRPMRWIMRAAAILLIAFGTYWILEQYDPASPETNAPITSVKPEIKPRVPTVRRSKPTPPRQADPAPGDQPTSDYAQQDPTPLDPAPIEEMTGADAPDYAALADDFFRERDFLPPKGSKGGQAGSAAYNQALDKFQDGKYTDALSKLKPSPGSDTDAIQQKELLALSQYKTKQYDSAVANFRDIAASGKQPYAQRAEWGMALTLLNQMPTKKPLFDRVMANILNNPQHLFFEKAKSLEERLK